MWQAWLGGQLLAVLSNSKEQENATISELGDELGELEMEPKQESFWWTHLWRGGSGHDHKWVGWQRVGGPVCSRVCDLWVFSKGWEGHCGVGEDFHKTGPDPRNKLFHREHTRNE